MLESNMIEDLGMIHVRPNGHKDRKYKVQCEDCHKQWDVLTHLWKKRKTNKCASCACHLRTHGLSKHPLYKKWKEMHYRCKHPEIRGASYANVTICEEWNTFEPYYNWAISNGFQEGLEMDKDMLCDEMNISPKIYSPKTCKWITQKENRSYSSKLMRKEV